MLKQANELHILRSKILTFIQLIRFVVRTILLVSAVVVLRLGHLLNRVDHLIGLLNVLVYKVLA